MNVNFWKVDVHINWTIVYIEMVLEVPLIASFILRCDAPKTFYEYKLQILCSAAATNASLKAQICSLQFKSEHSLTINSRPLKSHFYNQQFFFLRRRKIFVTVLQLTGLHAL